MTLFEATNDLGSRTRYDFLLVLQGEPLPVRVGVAACGGVPTFLAAWDELHRTLFRIGVTQESDERFGELTCKAIADGQRLVDLLFSRPDERRVVVTGVTRDYIQGSQLPDAGEG
jgi:hypothetical protein